MMGYIDFYKSDRVRSCKFCVKDIKRDEVSLRIADIHVSPKRVDVHFHVDCFYSKLKQATVDVASIL